uniref:Uncharacterized protein n=1 Tax=Rhizobium rhizogenes TaxID=359 RepID=A0A7S4ZU47_RHIRH|nr:hypothetical protein pC5.7d_630 [Rhizobium rhizogenes]
MVYPDWLQHPTDMPLLFIVGQVHRFRVVMPYCLARYLIHPYIGMD